MNKEFDVFISYNWQYKDQVRKLYDELTNTFKLKCWLDDVELKPNSLTDELARGIQNSRVFVCCVTKKYCESLNCVDEINHARNLKKPMVILMLERIIIEEIGGVGFIIGGLVRIPCYKYDNMFFESSGDLFNQILIAINEKLNESFKPKTTSSTNQGHAFKPATRLASIFPIRHNLLKTTKPPQSLNLIRTLNGHEHAVFCMKTISNNRLATGSADCTVLIWNLSDFSLVKTLKGHKQNITCLKACFKDNKLVSGSNDHDIIIWNMINYEMICRLDGHSDGITGFKLLPDNILISCSYDANIKFWDLTTNKLVKTINGYTSFNKKLSNTIYSVFSKNKSSDENNTNNDNDNDNDKTKEKKDENKFKSMIKKGHSKVIYCLKLLSNDRLASGAADKKIKIWNLNNYSFVTNLIGHKDTVVCLKKCDKQNTNNKLISGSFDHTICVWDLTNYTCLQTLIGHQNAIQCLTVLPENKLASGSSDFTIRIWNLDENYECLQTLKGHEKNVNHLKLLSKTSNTLVSCSNDNTIKLWNLKNSECMETLIEHTKCVSCICLLSGSKIASGSWDNTVKVWQLDHA